MILSDEIRHNLFKFAIAVSTKQFKLLDKQQCAKTEEQKTLKLF